MAGQENVLSRAPVHGDRGRLASEAVGVSVQGKVRSVAGVEVEKSRSGRGDGQDAKVGEVEGDRLRQEQTTASELEAIESVLKFWRRREKVLEFRLEANRLELKEVRETLESLENEWFETYTSQQE